MERWSGTHSGDIVGRRLVEAFPDFDESKFGTRLEQVFDSGAPVLLSAQFHGQVLPLEFDDGTHRVHECTITAIPTPSGERCALFAVQDVTALVRQIDALRKTRQRALAATAKAEEAKRLAELRNRELVVANRELAQFAHAASHDLQEPLRTLISFSTFLREDLGDDLNPAAARDLDHIRAAADRMRRLIEGLLSLSRVARAEISCGEVSLETCVSDALATLAARIEASGATVAGAEELPAASGDPDLLTLVFQNLLANAFKFVPAGRKPMVELKAEQDGEHVHVTIRDNGIGIEEKHHDTIFRPFFRLHGVGAFEGSGIGLAIVRRALERLHGRISVESNQGDGCTFRVALPASRPLET